MWNWRELIQDFGENLYIIYIYMLKRYSLYGCIVLFHVFSLFRLLLLILTKRVSNSKSVTSCLLPIHSIFTVFFRIVLISNSLSLTQYVYITLQFLHNPTIDSLCDYLHIHTKWIEDWSTRNSLVLLISRCFFYGTNV